MTTTIIDGATVSYTNGKLMFQPRAFDEIITKDGRVLEAVFAWEVWTRESYGFTEGQRPQEIWAPTWEAALDMGRRSRAHNDPPCPVLREEPKGWNLSQIVEAGDFLATVRMAERFAPMKNAAE